MGDCWISLDYDVSLCKLLCLFVDRAVQERVGKKYYHQTRLRQCKGERTRRLWFYCSAVGLVFSDALFSLSKTLFGFSQYFTEKPQFE